MLSLRNVRLAPAPGVPLGLQPSLPPPLSPHYCARQAGTPSGAGRIKARNFLRAGGGGQGWGRAEGGCERRVPALRLRRPLPVPPRPPRRDSLPARIGEEMTPGWSPPGHSSFFQMPPPAPSLSSVRSGPGAPLRASLLALPLSY